MDFLIIKKKKRRRKKEANRRLWAKKLALGICVKEKDTRSITKERKGFTFTIHKHLQSRHFCLS